MLRALILSLSAVFVLYGCETIEHKKNVDSAPVGYFDETKVPAVVPIAEPKSKQGNMAQYTVFGKQYKVMTSAHDLQQVGMASWYGSKFHGNLTSNGETYDMYGLSAAHKSLPLPTYLKVTNLGNGKSIIVRVNDRGPFHGDRLIDLSYAAAKQLDFHQKGTAKVKLQAITFVDGKPYLAGSSKIHKPKAPETQAIYTYIQLGAFSQHASANNVKEKARIYIDHDVIITSAKHADKVLHKVRIGPIKNQYALNKIKRIVEQHALGQTLVVER